jgi:hypothetical protein
MYLVNQFNSRFIYRDFFVKRHMEAGNINIVVYLFISFLGTLEIRELGDLCESYLHVFQPINNNGVRTAAPSLIMVSALPHRQ